MKSLWSPHRVPTESLISPSGTVRGLLGESPLYGDYIGSPSGLLGDSLETPWRLLRDSLRTPWDSLGLLGDSLGTPQQCVAQCNNLKLWQKNCLPISMVI